LRRTLWSTHSSFCRCLTSDRRADQRNGILGNVLLVGLGLYRADNSLINLLRLLFLDWTTAFCLAIHQTIDSGQPEGIQMPTRIGAKAERRSNGARDVTAFGASN